MEACLKSWYDLPITSDSFVWQAKKRINSKASTLALSFKDPSILSATASMLKFDESNDYIW